MHARILFTAEDKGRNADVPITVSSRDAISVGIALWCSFQETAVKLALDFSVLSKLPVSSTFKTVNCFNSTHIPVFSVTYHHCLSY
jgi:hypothetical protein